jgi:GNAT superfamily N-acetyltransferase
MVADDIPATVILQALAFPAPFDPELLWQAEHLFAHRQKFPSGQFVARSGTVLVGTCSNTRISSAQLAQPTWDQTVGGPFLDRFAPDGDTLYGLDISVHPDYRRRGIGRALYQARFELVRALGLRCYATTCRIPDFAASGVSRVEAYVDQVSSGERVDRTLTPLLRMGLQFVKVKPQFMADRESGDAAVHLEWKP